MYYTLAQHLKVVLVKRLKFFPSSYKFAPSKFSHFPMMFSWTEVPQGSKIFQEACS